MKNTSLIHFNDASIIPAKINYLVFFQKYLTFRHSLFIFVSAKR